MSQCRLQVQKIVEPTIISRFDGTDGALMALNSDRDLNRQLVNQHLVSVSVSVSVTLVREHV